MPTTRTKLVIYTVLIGAKEPLRNPLAQLPADATTDLDLDFVCLTDSRALTSPVWRLQHFSDRHLPPEKLSRRPKALPHDYFPDAAYSLYIDNTVEFKRLPQAADLVGLEMDGQPYLFKAFKHSTRTDPSQEAAVLVTLGYDDVDTVCRQLDFYAAQRPLEAITPLTTGTVLLRAHHHPAVREFGRLWWESILAFSKRDQLSLDYARQEAGCEIDYFHGITRDNDFIFWDGVYTAHRVKANFDTKRYAWLHRHDPAAVADPKAHYLAHGSEDDAAYLREAPVLDFLCWKHRSTLGSQVAPRRHMAGTLEAVLQPLQRPGCKHLLIRLHGETGPQAFDDTELEAATNALGVLVSPSGSLLVLDLQADQITADDKVYAVPQPAFDVVIVIGVAGPHLAAAVHKLRHMANRGSATMVFALAGSAVLADAAEAERRLAAALGATAQGSLHAARHDDVRGAMSNAVYVVQWQPASLPSPLGGEGPGVRAAASAC
jgi:hypothetical protein